jgi:phospholipase/carboxylesterase
MSDFELQCIEHETASPVEGSVIWLHGLGADGHDFESIVPELAVAPLRFILPHAPVQPVTINGGMSMRSWFDVLGLDPESRYDEKGIRLAETWIRALIERERERGIPSERIVLAGFSQGGAIALHTALRYPEPLAAVIGLSTMLPLPSTLEQEVHESNRGIPVFIGHGDQDPLVAPELGEFTKTTLEGLGYEVAYHRYPIPHAVSPAEISDLKAWMKERLV